MNLPKFKNKKLFEQAFIHRSYLNEVDEKLSSNERLEFLGDAVLSFVVSRSLYDEFGALNEGELTNLRALLVNTTSLAEVAKELGLGKLLKLSKGEEQSKGRENTSLLANSFEALVGAYYLDSGIEAVSEFIQSALLHKAKKLIERKTLKDTKSVLQEFVQGKKDPSPSYKVLTEEGPAHDKIFTVAVYSGSKVLGKGTGKSKQEAEKTAAHKALVLLGVAVDPEGSRGLSK